MMMFSDRKIRMWWWWGPDDDDVVLSKYDDDDVLIERSEYDDELMLEYDDVRLMMVLIERSEADDNDESDWKIRVWWWCCCWSKGQSAEEDVADLKVKVLKMMLLIERSKYWRCYWSKGPNAEDVVADWKIKMLKMLLIEAVKELMMMKTEYWRWRLRDVEKLPMIYRCVTLMMLMTSPISLLLSLFMLL